MIRSSGRWFGLLLVSVLACREATEESEGGDSGAGKAGAGGMAGSTGGTAGASAGTAGDAQGGAQGGTQGGVSGKSGAPSDGGAAGDPSDAAGADSGGESAMGGSAGAGGEAGGDVATPGEHWQPVAGLTWQWQLSETVSDVLDVDVYDIDWESDREIVEALHARGKKVICYVSVGSWEDFRPDADDFPEAVLGNDYDGWPGERYLDIRSDAVKELMLARFDVCRASGFDAIEPDNMDVFELGSASGFPLTRIHGLAYAAWLAEAAHSRGLGIGQKNASSLSGSLVNVYDWVLTESCYSDGNWCDEVEAYAQANKPVFMCEYEAASFDDACSQWEPSKYSPILKNLDLDAEVTFCP